MRHVVCEQYKDGVQDGYVLIIPALEGESPEETLARKRAGADLHEWSVEDTSETSFHAWKEYTDGDGTAEAPNRKDRYFYIVERP